MDKAIVYLTNWYLYFYNGDYTVLGEADKHPVLGNNSFIESSKIEKHTFYNDIVTCETQNTIYVCPLKYLMQFPYHTVTKKYIEQLSHMADTSEDILDVIIVASAAIALADYNKDDVKKSSRVAIQDMIGHIKNLQAIGQAELKTKEEMYNRHLISESRKYQDCVYLEITNPSRGNTMAYHLGRQIGIVRPIAHTGTFQDSVIFIKKFGYYDSERLDFRYFPSGFFGTIMETYFWSDNIKQVVIKNVTGRGLIFNNTRINDGETVSIFRDNNSK